MRTFYQKVRHVKIEHSDCDAIDYIDNHVDTDNGGNDINFIDDIHDDHCNTGDGNNIDCMIILTTLMTVIILR